MGHNRIINRRKPKADTEALIYYVRSLFMGLEQEIVVLPKCLWHYVRQIERAYAGDLTTLREAIKTVTQRSKIVQMDEQTSGTMLKWKLGMTNHILSILKGLTAFESLLTAYHGAIHGNAKQIPKITFGLDTFQRNKKLSESRDEYESDYQQPNRQRI